MWGFYEVITVLMTRGNTPPGLMLYWIWMCRNQHAFWLMKYLLCSPILNTVLYSQNRSVSWTFHSLCFRWLDRLHRPWLLSAKQLLRKPSLPGFARSPWPDPAQPTAFLSASSQALLWPNQIPHREGKHSCNPRRCLVWEQVSFLLEKRIFWMLRNTMKLFNKEKNRYPVSWEFFTGYQNILKRIANI